MRRLKGWGLGRGCALPSWGSGGLPQKKNQFCAKNYAILSKFWYFFPILQQKVGGLSPSPESGGTYPPVPPRCSDAYAVNYIMPDVIRCQDGVTKLLEASSAQLYTAVVDHRSVISVLREESSDESTVISSQTSTLTRNQGRTTNSDGH